MYNNLLFINLYFRYFGIDRINFYKYFFGVCILVLNLDRIKVLNMFYGMV